MAAPEDVLDRSPTEPVRSSDWLATVGVLPVATAAAALIALILHRIFWPAASYTWERPVQILIGVVSGGYFPVFALAAFVLGFLTRLGRGTERAELNAYLEQLATARAQRGRLVRALGLALLAMLAALILMPAYEPADLLCVAVAALYVALRRPRRRDWIRSAAELVLVALLFTFVSYAFTVGKSLLFRFGTPHDAVIMAAEHALTGVAPHRVIAGWAARSQLLVWVSDHIYYLFFQHMFLVSLFLVGTGDRRLRIEYMGALAICYLLGGPAYHLLPAWGPAYADPEAYGYLRSWPTITSYFQQLLGQNTAAAARGDARWLQTYEYAACMPSLHMAHELVMLWFARRSAGFFALSFGFTSMTALAIVVLGWHYPIDVLAGAVLAAIAIALAHRAGPRLVPRALFERGPAPAARPGPVTASSA